MPVPFPGVLGHEGAGIVDAIGEGVTHVVPGDHVLLSFNSCGACSACADHQPGYCAEFFPRNFLGQSRAADGGLWRSRSRSNTNLLMGKS